MKRLTTLDAIQSCISIHGTKYDYSKFDYKDSTKKVKIICHIHGEFEQRYHDHINGRGCPKCSNVGRLNTKDFIVKANEKHNNFYNYSTTTYSGYEKKALIICPIHGEFEQTPHNHLSGKGCNKCGIEKWSSTHISSNDYFISKANKIHKEKYQYLSKYKTQNDNIEILCLIHGVFSQKPKHHLKGNGCPHCKKSKGERDIKQFLIENNIKFIPQKRFKDCKDINELPFDFYLPEYNICIEYDGRQHFIPIKRWGGEKELKKIQKRDNIKTKYCQDNKIKLLRFKYTQKMKQILEQIQIELRASEGGTDSKLLVVDMKDIYVKAAKTNNFN